MGQLRTINHPSVEIQEVDVSGSAEQVGGCTSLVMGFFPQGESGKPVNPTSLASVKSYFGTPENEAERYAYYGCKTVFDNGGNLIAARIPYNNNSQYLTPAVKYNIEEWATKHIKTYNKSEGYEIKNRQTSEYGELELGNDTNPEKFQFYYNPDNPTVYTENITAFDQKTYDGEIVTKNALAISTNSIKSDAFCYYELTYNDFTKSQTYGDRTISVLVTDFEKEEEIEISGIKDRFEDLPSDAEVGIAYRVREAHDGHPENSIYQRRDIEFDRIARTEDDLEDIEPEVKNADVDMAVWVGYASPGDNVVETYDALEAMISPDIPPEEQPAAGSIWMIENKYSLEGEMLYPSYSIFECVDNEGTKNWALIENYRGGHPEYMVQTFADLPSGEDAGLGEVVRVAEAHGGKPAFSSYVYAENELDEKTWQYAGSDCYRIYRRASSTWEKYYGSTLIWNYKKPAGFLNYSFNIADSKAVFNAEGITVNSMSTNPVWQHLDGDTVVAAISASLDTGTITLSATDLTPSVAFEPLFQKRNIEPGMDLSFLTAANTKYFNIIKHDFKKWKSNIESIGGSYFYSETICADNKSNFYYNPSNSSPVTALVDCYTSTGSEKVMAIKSYYESGEGMKYPDCESEDYLELRIWDYGTINSISDLKETNADAFDVVHREYIGTLGSETSKIANKDFKSVAISSDVTVGYSPEGSEITSETLAIPGTDSWNEENYPQIEDKNPFGTGFMKVLTHIRPNRADAYNKNDFFQFVSPYTSIKDVALAHSEKYQWIHWVTPSASEEVTDKNVLLSRTLGCEMKDVPVQLSEIENVVAIVPDQDGTGFIPLSEYQDYRDEAKTPAKNTIVIANITEQKFGSDMYNNAVASDDETTTRDYSDEVLGIVPVLMGGFQALPRQSRIELPDGITNGKLFDALEAIKRGSSIENDPAPEEDHVPVKGITLNKDGYVRPLGTDGEYDAYDSTYSNQLLSNVPSIDLNANYKPNGSKVNYVTLAVCKLSLSKVNDNKIAITVLESFTGSLDKNAKDDKGNSLFIDNVVNSEDSGSSYVRCYSNYETTLTGSQTITDERREVVAPASNDTKATIAVPASLGKELWWTKLKPSMTLGFTNEQTKKYISYATIVATMENVFDSLSNVDELDIDLVVDAGLSTIANRIKKYCDENPEETKALYDVFFDKINSVEDIAGWKSICSKLATFCQTTRKDCVAFIDAPRSLCVKDNVKLVQPGGKYSVDYDILPKFNFIGGLNSSYVAGYCNWLMAVDDFTSKNVWIPPSIAAEGAEIYTNYNANYWEAPAGATRGNVLWAVDVAFNPNAAQQDSIYTKGWNYAISSSGNIMVWGQKTMLNSTSSFNRLNVRFLFNRLERMTRKAVKPFIFELNNSRTRNRILDITDPIFNNVKSMGGIYDYQLICNEVNNTDQVIMNNELRLAAMVKPTYVAEFIILTFFNVAQDLDFSELYDQL